MKKQQIVSQLILELEALFQVALSAAKRAHSSATDKANIAENKYDTLGLEAAYLAEGQAKRAAKCRADIEIFQKLSDKTFLPDEAITVGALVSLVDLEKQQQTLFLAPAAGGHNLTFEQKTIVVITPSSPLGGALMGKYIDEEFEFVSGRQKKSYRISEIY